MFGGGIDAVDYDLRHSIFSILSIMIDQTSLFSEYSVSSGPFSPFFKPPIKYGCSFLKKGVAITRIVYQSLQGETKTDPNHLCMTDLMSNFESLLEDFPILCAIFRALRYFLLIKAFSTGSQENGNIGCRKGLKNMAPQEALPQVNVATSSPRASKELSMTDTNPHKIL